jgi:hypothetical protein
MLSEQAVQRVVAIAKGENPPLPAKTEIIQEPPAVEEAALAAEAEPAAEAAAEAETEGADAA